MTFSQQSLAGPSSAISSSSSSQVRSQEQSQPRQQLLQQTNKITFPIPKIASSSSSEPYIDQNARLPSVLRFLNKLLWSRFHSIGGKDAIGEPNQVKKRKVAQPIDLTDNSFLDDLVASSSQTMSSSSASSSQIPPPLGTKENNIKLSNNRKLEAKDTIRHAMKSVNINFQTEFSPLKLRPPTRGAPRKVSTLMEDREALLVFCRAHINRYFQKQSMEILCGFDPTLGEIPMWDRNICGECTTINRRDDDICAQAECGHILPSSTTFIDYDSVTSALCKVSTIFSVQST